MAPDPCRGCRRPLGRRHCLAKRRLHVGEERAHGDLVVDALGGASSGRFLRTLRRGGALFPIFPLGFADFDEAERLGVTVSATQVRSSGARLAEVASLLDDGTIQVLLDSVYSLAEARKAHERAARGASPGKLVLAVE